MPFSLLALIIFLIVYAIIAYVFILQENAHTSGKK